MPISVAGVDSSAGTFTFGSDLNETQEREIQVVIGDAGDGIDNINLSIDPNGWFVAAAGGCLDPMNAINQSEIEDNIEQSIGFEEDDDEDGIEDCVDTEDGDEVDSTN